jgi:transcriptional regulator with XRE-family HTH domain
MNRLKDVLKSLGIKQVEFSEMSGLSKAHVSAICTNATNPSLKKLYEISQVLNVPAYTLVGDYKEPDDIEIIVKAAEILGVEVQELLDLKKKQDK